MKAAVNTQWHKRIYNEMLSRFIIIFQTQELNITSSPPHKYERAQKMSQHAHKAEKKSPKLLIKATRAFWSLSDCLPPFLLSSVFHPSIYPPPLASLDLWPILVIKAAKATHLLLCLYFFHVVYLCGCFVYLHHILEHFVQLKLF